MTMCKQLWIGLSLTLALMFLAGCSSTTLTGSWKNPAFSEQVNKIYVVGVSNQETNRRIFEDGFAQEFNNYGVTGVSSYRDFPSVQEAHKDSILSKVESNGADSVLLTRVIDQRTEEVVNPGRVSGYDNSPRYYGRGGYSPRPYYRNYNSYYDRRYEMTYEPATVSQFQVVTIESNLYDTASGELIWSAQLETIVEGNIDTLINDFIKTVTKDLKAQGLI